jgi:hypothetical protein
VKHSEYDYKKSKTSCRTQIGKEVYKITYEIKFELTDEYLTGKEFNLLEGMGVKGKEKNVYKFFKDFKILKAINNILQKVYKTTNDTFIFKEFNAVADNKVKLQLVCNRIIDENGNIPEEFKSDVAENLTIELKKIYDIICSNFTLDWDDEYPLMINLSFDIIIPNFYKTTFDFNLTESKAPQSVRSFFKQYFEENLLELFYNIVSPVFFSNTTFKPINFVFIDNESGKYIGYIRGNRVVVRDQKIFEKYEKCVEDFCDIVKKIPSIKDCYYKIEIEDWGFSGEEKTPVDDFHYNIFYQIQDDLIAPYEYNLL